MHLMMNYRQFEGKVKATDSGRDLESYEIYHLFLLYCAAHLQRRVTC